jgi:hypothetical protein
LGAPLSDSILKQNDVDLIAFALALRKDANWQTFRGVYSQLVQAIAEYDVPIDEATVAKAVNAALPSRAKVVLRSLRAKPVVALVVNAVRVYYGEWIKLPSAAGHGIGLVNGVAQALAQYSTTLRADVASSVRGALRSVHPEVVEQAELAKQIKKL